MIVGCSSVCKRRAVARCLTAFCRLGPRLVFLCSQSWAPINSLRANTLLHWYTWTQESFNRSCQPEFSFFFSPPVTDSHPVSHSRRSFRVPEEIKILQDVVNSNTKREPNVPAWQLEAMALQTLWEAQIILVLNGTDFRGAAGRIQTNCGLVGVIQSRPGVFTYLLFDDKQLS